jgi:hypothetical protein
VNNSAEGIVVQGHGIASCNNSYNLFTQGSISMQFPFFKKCGFDVSHFFMGTINISFRNFKFELINPVHHFPKVKWCADLPAENFSFFSCNLNLLDNSPVDALVYWPHPSTKPAFYQDSSVLEFLAPKMANIGYGQKIYVSANQDSILFTKTE